MLTSLHYQDYRRSLALEPPVVTYNSGWKVMDDEKCERQRAHSLCNGDHSAKPSRPLSITFNNTGN